MPGLPWQLFGCLCTGGREEFVIYFSGWISKWTCLNFPCLASVGLLLSNGKQDFSRTGALSELAGRLLPAGLCVHCALTFLYR